MLTSKESVTHTDMVRRSITGFVPQYVNQAPASAPTRALTWTSPDMPLCNNKTTGTTCSDELWCFNDHLATSPQPANIDDPSKAAQGTDGVLRPITALPTSFGPPVRNEEPGTTFYSEGVSGFSFNDFCNANTLIDDFNAEQAALLNQTSVEFTCLPRQNLLEFYNEPGEPVAMCASSLSSSV